jgi:hypothetical protein
VTTLEPGSRGYAARCPSARTGRLATAKMFRGIRMFRLNAG